MAVSFESGKQGKVNDFFEYQHYPCCIFFPVKQELTKAENENNIRAISYLLGKSGMLSFQIEGNYTDKDGKKIQDTLLFTQRDKCSYNHDIYKDLFLSILWTFDLQYALYKPDKKLKQGEFHCFFPISAIGQNQFTEFPDGKISVKNINDLVEVLKSVKGEDYNINKNINMVTFANSEPFCRETRIAIGQSLKTDWKNTFKEMLANYNAQGNSWTSNIGNGETSANTGEEIKNSFFENNDNPVAVIPLSNEGLSENDNYLLKCALTDVLSRGGLKSFTLQGFYTNAEGKAVTDNLVFVQQHKGHFEPDFYTGLYKSCLWSFNLPYGLMRLPNEHFVLFSEQGKYDLPGITPDKLNISNIQELENLFKTLKSKDYQIKAQPMWLTSAASCQFAKVHRNKLCEDMKKYGNNTVIRQIAIEANSSTPPVVRSVFEGNSQAAKEVQNILFEEGVDAYLNSPVMVCCLTACKAELSESENSIRTKSLRETLEWGRRHAIYLNGCYTDKNGNKVKETIVLAKNPTSDKDRDSCFYNSCLWAYEQEFGLLKCSKEQMKVISPLPNMAEVCKDNDNLEITSIRELENLFRKLKSEDYTFERRIIDTSSYREVNPAMFRMFLINKFNKFVDKYGKRSVLLSLIVNNERNKDNISSEEYKILKNIYSGNSEVAKDYEEYKKVLESYKGSIKNVIEGDLR